MNAKDPSVVPLNNFSSASLRCRVLFAFTLQRGFKTLDLFRLNCKSQFKLASSCHGPDMWLVGVIVLFISPVQSLPSRH